jgi:hypothetical protein
LAKSSQIRSGLPSRRAGEKSDGRQLARLLRTDRERPCGSRSADQRDELASSQSIELHPVPASQGRIAGYRIASDQSAGNGAKQ